MKNRELTVAAATLASAVETWGTFGNWCPPLADVRKAGRDRDGELVGDLRGTYVHAGLSSLLFAGLLAWIVGSPLPLVGWGGASALAMGNYEHALPIGTRLLDQPAPPPILLVRPAETPYLVNVL